MILVIDNYDSFVHNLARHLRRLGAVTHVVRNDAVSNADIESLRPQAIVISPGPCTPAEAGCSLAVIQRFSGVVPILGVCLGHQAIAQAFGGRIVRADEPMHGRTSAVIHAGTGLFAGLPSPLVVGRYHSLVAERSSLPDCLQVTARTPAGTIMAIAHQSLPVLGVQFHPESVLTQGGYRLLANFLQAAGLRDERTPIPEDEWRPPAEPAFQLPSRVVTW